MPKHVWGVNYAYQKSVSYSQYSIYKQCQHQWYLNYIKKVKIFKPSVHLTFGTSFHETMQDWLKVMFEESAKKADEMNLGELLKERMYENYKEALADQKGEHSIKPKDFKEFIEDGVTFVRVGRNFGWYFTIKDNQYGNWFTDDTTTDLTEDKVDLNWSQLKANARQTTELL